MRRLCFAPLNIYCRAADDVYYYLCRDIPLIRVRNLVVNWKYIIGAIHINVIKVITKQAFADGYNQLVVLMFFLI
jgi:hypothetical protein